ncbi:hypothetical protein QBC37DRAFT_296081 [Rhypophila decipiens]|uniref:Uncharacterized protein n=1 Tax=Rhypophila decipiens TaxID=261697 RepID=A0AAN6XXI6_9PEZI|nr:hypothetical protein QBC37DRAFT_296081 [Rhypophila decipiens]
MASPLSLSPRQSYIPFCVNNCEWNSNMMIVPNTITSQYSYILSFQNIAANQTYQVKCFNVKGSNGGYNGMFPSNYAPVSFTIAPGVTKSLAVEEMQHPHKSSAACAWAPGTTNFPLTQLGMYAGVWAEFSFGGQWGDGWTSAVCSALATPPGPAVPGCRLHHGGVYSTIWPGGAVADNAYISGETSIDALGLNIPPGNVTIQATVGFS